MYPLKRSLVAASLAVLTACGSDTTVSPVAELVDGPIAGRITTAGSISASYNLKVGESVKINPRTTSRSNRLKWTSTNESVARVNSQGTVTALAAGDAIVTVSGSSVLESYSVVVASPVAATVTSFSLQPKTGITLLPGQQQLFTPVATWSDGKQYSLSVNYSATGGTISSTGLFTAGTAAGRYLVIAACLCGLSDTAVVDVAQLVSLTVSPKTVSLAAGATQQFGVTASWSTGSTTVPPVTWSATGGSVSSTGAYVAPSTAGTYRVIVAHTNGTVRDTAVVTVAGSVISDPPAVGTACPNEPSGYQLHGDVVLNSTIAPVGFSFWGDNRSLAYDAAPNGETSVLAWRKPAGTAAGQIGFFATKPFAQSPRAVYSCIMFKRSANYIEHPSGTKFVYPFVSNAAMTERPFQLGMLPVDSINSGKFQWMVEMYSGDSVQRMRGSNVSNTIMTNGRWYRLEFLAISNTPGGQNSVIRWWTSEWNGSSWSSPILNGDHSNVRIAKDGTGAWSSWDYNIYYGGSDGPVAPADQFIYLNRARISVGGF